jgi:erythronate-4-phosphate dehydrogenase
VRILADPNITEVEAAFSGLGEVFLQPGREWTPALARDADAWLIRSVTRVDRQLLEGSRVRFIASATSGVDHVDLNLLRERGVHFVSAPGSNARSVAEYVVAAVVELLLAQRRDANGLRAAVIGCGQVGSRVVTLLEALGMHCLLNDPPLKAAGGNGRYLDLDQVLDADIVTLHVPLTRTGPYPTAGLLNAARLRRLRPDAILINTARGGVIDEAALLEQLDQHPAMRCVIDCWEGEPAIDPRLLQKATIATPHIAGYSFDGKLRATEMIYAAACDFFKLPRRWVPQDKAPPPCVRIDASTSVEGLAALSPVVRNCYDPARDSAPLKAMLSLSTAERAAGFDRLRRDYPVRREFGACEIITSAPGDATAATLARLGFRLRST